VRLSTWLTHHLQGLLSTLGQLARTPLATLMTLGMIGITLALPATLFLVVDNARVVAGGWARSAQLAVFLKPDLDDRAAEKVAKTVAGWGEVRDVRLISRAEALVEYRKLAGAGEALDLLDGNPLPAVVLVRPREAGAEWAGEDELLRRLEGLPEADVAQVDLQWVRRFQAIVAVVQRAVVGLAVMLSLGVVLVVANTVRSAIQGRRGEIEVEKLFGATDAFVRRPFLYTGLWYGLLGGISAWLLVTLAHLALEGPVQQAALLYASEFRLRGFGAVPALTIVLGGAALGLVGAWLAVGRHLREVEP
jgi:cell division transport system permease protein